MSSDSNIQNIAEKLSPLERAIVPFLNLSMEEILEKSKLDKTSLSRAFQFLSNKGLVIIKKDTKDIVELGTNGIYYKKSGLPERKLLTLLESKNHLSLEEANKLSKLSDNEFKVSLGVLKGKALIQLSNGKLSLNATKAELTKKSPEEALIEVLPKPLNSLSDVERFALSNLQKRKEIVELKKQSEVSFELTNTGKQIAGKEIVVDLIEEVTPEIIKDWNRKKRIRRYDIQASVPKIYGGKKHFVNQATDYGKKIWLEMGFKEMSGNKVVSSFWNFDALFTAQDHPVREMHDTFFIKDISAKLPSKALVESVKKSHEQGVGGSKGWRYLWNEKTAQRVLLRTHTTALSSQTLSKLKKSDLPAKFFSIGKCFRNETVDWKHGFEFNQTEGIVIDPNANLRNLLGYLTELANKMGFKKVRFQPSFYPYTEPSVEGMVYHEGKKEWIEIFAAGIFRPEVTIPLLGEAVPVLAWGPGFDRLMMMAYEISDLRELYSNDIKKLREMSFWKQ